MNMMGWMILLMSFQGANVEKHSVSEYCNPIQVQLADPWVLQHEGVYYLYGTHDRNPGLGVPVYTSTDLVHWSWRGFAFKKTASTWSQVNFWGPEVLRFEGRFRMYYNASPGPKPGPPFNMHLCIAESDSPLGPFREVKAPWFQPEGKDEAIDQSVFLDDDGKGYLYWTRVTDGRNEIQVVPLTDDLLRFAGPSRLCVQPTQAWESHPWNGHVVAEGSFAFKRGATCYLTYTGNHFMDSHYAIGYATSDSPLGPWEKSPDNPILAANDHVSGPGNGMLIPSPDGTETFMVYHTHQSVRELGWRQIAIDRVTFTADKPNRIVVTGPTHTPQPLPSGAPARQRGRDDDFTSGVLDRARWRVVNEDPTAWHMENGALVITAGDGDMWKHRGDFRNLFLQHLPEGNTAVTTRLFFEPKANYEQAFLCLWQDHDNYIRLSRAWADGPKILVGREQEGVYRETAVDYTGGTELHLRITKDGDTYQCRVSTDGQSWKAVGPAIEMDFSLPRAGLGAVSPGSGNPVQARFEAICFSSDTARSFSQ